MDIDDNTVQSKSYTDLTLFYDAEVGGGRWRAALAVTNVLDADPPIRQLGTAFQRPERHSRHQWLRSLRTGYNLSFRYNF